MHSCQQTTYFEGSRNRTLRCNITLIGICGLDVVGIDIVTASLGDTLKLDACVFIWPDVVVAVLGSLLDSRNLYVFRRTGARGRGRIVDDLARQGLLHALLFALFNLQKTLGNDLALVLGFRGCLQPPREILLN